MKKSSHPVFRLAVILKACTLAIALVWMVPSESLADPSICPCFPDADVIRAEQDAFKSMFPGGMCTCEAIPRTGKTQLFVKACVASSTSGTHEILWEADADRVRCIRDTTAIGGDSDVLSIAGSEVRTCIRLLKNLCRKEGLAFR